MLDDNRGFVKLLAESTDETTTEGNSQPLPVKMTGKTVLMPISSLEMSGSPRLNGEDPAHIQLLMGVVTELPPVLVHRQTMRVIDGRHRLRAAALRGDTEIAVEFFDGDDSAAFILAVKANITHGLPLSLADRRAAAMNIVTLHPEWSDRGIAALSGLSADTVSTIRQHSTVGSGQLNSRVGRDGRVRPVDPIPGRIRASEMFAARPHASLREVARGAGIAVGTARDVRDRLLQGEDPISSKNSSAGPTKIMEGNSKRTAGAGLVASQGNVRAVHSIEIDHLESTIKILRKDPSLRFNEAGRRLLRLLDRHTLVPEEEAWLLDTVPAHCANVIADVARAYSTMWQRLAKAIEERVEEAAI